MGSKRIFSLGDLARHAGYIAAHCRGCGKRGHFAGHELASFYGHGKEISSLRFRCVDCGSTDFDHHWELPDRGPWRPAFPQRRDPPSDEP